MQDWLEEQGLGVRSLLSKLSAEDYDEFESEREWRNKLSEMGEAEYVSFEASWMKLNMEVARRIRSSDGEEKHADFNAKAAEEASKLTDLRAKLRGETESNR